MTVAVAQDYQGCYSCAERDEVTRALRRIFYEKNKRHRGNHHRGMPYNLLPLVQLPGSEGTPQRRRNKENF